MAPGARIINLRVMDAEGKGYTSDAIRAIDWAVESGFKKLEANIFTTNKQSLGMFRKAGFAEEGVRKNRIQVGRELIDEVVMGKRGVRKVRNAE